jgi:hypothetical protein
MTDTLFGMAAAVAAGATYGSIVALVKPSNGYKLTGHLAFAIALCAVIYAELGSGPTQKLLDIGMVVLVVGYLIWLVGIYIGWGLTKVFINFSNKL